MRPKLLILLSAFYFLLSTFSPCARAQLVNNGNFVTNTIAPTIRTLPTGASLNVTGAAVSGDMRYVTMGANVQSSQLLGLDTFVVPLATTGNNNTSGLSTFARVAPGGSLVATILPSRPVLTSQFFSPTLPPEQPTLDSLFQPQPPGATVLGNNPWGTPPSPSSSSFLAPLTPATVLFLETDPRLLAKSAPALADQMSLTDAIKRLSRATSTNIVLGTVGYKQAGADVTADCRFNLPAAPLRQTLARLVLIAAPNVSSVITAEDNVITITTLAQADRTVITKTYDANALLANSPDWLKRADRISPRGDSNIQPKNLLEMIVMTVRPEVWKANGGTSGELYQVNDRITITAPATVHAILGTRSLPEK